MRHVVLVALAACGDNSAPAVDARPIDTAPSSHTLSGTVRYEDRPQILAGSGGSLGPISPLPARGVMVTVFDDASTTVLATGVTADDGTYSLDFDATLDQIVHVTVIAQSMAALRPIKIVLPGALVHAFGGPSFAAGAPLGDVLVTDASSESEAFNIFDQLVTGFDRIHAVFDDPAPPTLTVEWEKGHAGSTRYEFGVHEILLEGQTDDDDGYDDTVMLHEMGHYVADTQGRDDSPGGQHDGSPVDARLAWSEGWATYWEMAVLGQPIYIDTNAEGGFNENADTEVTQAVLTGPLDEDVSENMVTEILWDLGDGGPGDDDPYAGSHDVNIHVQTYLKTATLRNVGHDGVDLVDFLDGWFVTAGLTACDAAKTIVQTTHQFPYDFNGPAGPCPD